MFIAWHDHEIVGLVSTILGIILTILKFFVNRSEKNTEGPSRWVRFKRGILIFFAGFLIGVGLCFYLFVGSDWKFKKAFQRFIKKNTQQHSHQKW